MFGWLKFEQRARRKTVKLDRTHLEARTRRFLKAYIEDDRSVSEVVALGFDADTAAKVARMVDRNEYKRRQGPIGVKITPRAFGRDWRLPLVNRFRE